MQRTVRKISQYLRTGDVTRCDSLGQRLYYEGEKNAEGKRDMQIDFLVQNDSFDVTSQRSTVDSCAKYLHGIAYKKLSLIEKRKGWIVDFKQS